jgi:hypothetical protein
MGKSIDPMLDWAKLGATTGSWPLPLLIGCDEFPAGYSLAGCSPAEPASASPAGNHPAPRRVARTSILQQSALLFPSLRGHSQLQRGEQAGAVIVGAPAEHAEDGVQHLASHRHEGLQFGLVTCQQGVVKGAQVGIAAHRH